MPWTWGQHACLVLWAGLCSCAGTSSFTARISPPAAAACSSLVARGQGQQAHAVLFLNLCSTTCQGSSHTAKFPKAARGRKIRAKCGPCCSERGEGRPLLVTLALDDFQAEPVRRSNLSEKCVRSTRRAQAGHSQSGPAAAKWSCAHSFLC